MQRIFIFLYSFFACLGIVDSVKAIVSENDQEVKSNLRISELIPNLLCHLPVDPAIPANFIALSPTGTLDPYDWIYWGPKDVLEEYFKNPSSLKEPILRVVLSSNVTQTGPNSFSDEESLKLFAITDPKAYASFKTQWGNYPVLVGRYRMEHKLMFLAWVGLNDPEGCWCLMFNLVYPDKKGHPNKQDRQLWQNLMMKTKQLKGWKYFKACGQDLQEGYTVVNDGGAKLKMIAEKRKSDGTIQVVVIPESSDVGFRYDDMLECAMGDPWKYGKHMVKVYGDIEVNRGNFHSTVNYVTSIFLKTVEEFSFKKEDDAKLLIFQKVYDETH